ncbi:mucin-19-like [Archocentrus centrarchus]|uniref:mucin-19-like n=1 Tax=Archocentrus centrarchus TaxID=63155 RepID=UPI0011E9F415|nr:mucin-19-like [Archocentrus centrarchus]
MTSQRWTPAVCFLLASDTCRTFGSGVLEPFSGLGFYVLSNCPFTFIRFTHNRVECDITIRRGNNGLLVQVEIIINKVSTVLQNGSIQVEEKSVSLPYDHTYQHIFQYGIYTRLRSSLLPLSITWHSVPGGIDSLWVELEEELSPDMTGLCGKHNVTNNEQQLIRESVITDDTCQTRDPASVTNPVCELFFSYTLDCLHTSWLHYLQLCHRNIYSYEKSEYIGCAFYKEIALHCGKSSYIWDSWRSVTQCAYPTCPGDLMYEEEGAAFVPSCSNPHPQFSSLDITSSCICPQGEVLNDQSDGFRCMNLSSCPCVFAGRTYLTGDIRNTKCQSCLCEGGKWHCSENFCPTKCQIEGQFVTTFDGKQYIVPGKCTYLAFQGLNWTVIIQFSESNASLKKVVLQHFRGIYTFTNNTVTFGDQEITDLHQSDHAQVFWQSSMYVHVETSSDIMIQIQMSPEIQLYMSVLTKHESVITGLCGNSNSDSTDDFTSSSGIVENSAQPFALSWSVGACAVNIPTTCINTHNEIFADERCSVLNNPTGIFSECHKHLPPDQYHAACIQRTCNCGSSVERCLCVALGSYAKACASLGGFVGDWRKATNCTLSCPKNQEFFYNIRACNRTCSSLSGTDPFCSLNDAPVEGCGCPEGTYLNQESTCTQKADCVCHHHGGITLPGPAVIEGRQCLCENGKLTCSKDCSCNNVKVCVQCSENAIKTAQKTCESLSKPLDSNMTCKSGCYCPNDQYEDHYGNCVSRDNCTCVYSGEVFSAGQHVRTNCKKCICGQGQWDCRDEPCQGMCQVYGNGHYETFDSKWYRFSGHCQYTLVEDYCGGTNGTFSVRVESVPCCDEALTCSRSILLDLKGKVTLILSDMKVAKRLQQDLTLQENSLYSVDSVGLYIIVSVPSSGITLIWDKHTRLIIKLHENWRNKVCGLCGNFDSNEMNDLQISGSAVMSGPMVFGNSWKAAAPPCSDVTSDIFPCGHNSYCSAWAQRRCMIIKGDAFRDCHLKVDPDPYYQACLLESCSCEFEGKFLGFCTAVAAYAEACSDQDVCINWRTPDLCPIYCDYYNKPDQSIWHYEACGKMQICGKEHHFTEKLEGCYPRCPMETPYYDVNAEECTTLRKCSCYFNDTIVQPGEVVVIKSFECPCENGTITCRYPTPEARSMTEIWTMIPTTNTSSLTSANTSATTETRLTVSTAFSMPATAILTTTEKCHFKYFNYHLYTNNSNSNMVNNVHCHPHIKHYSYLSFCWNTVNNSVYHLYTINFVSTPLPPCECKDLNKNKNWACGETWTDDCFQKYCVNGKIILTPLECPEPEIPDCPRGRVTNVSDGCCETWKCDCHCNLYGETHYISFQGVTFDFLDQCTYILVEERSPHHNLTIGVDSSSCVPGFQGSCSQEIILRYQNNVATLSIVPQLFKVQATLNNVIIQPPYEAHGLKFETVEHKVIIQLPDIRSFVSLTPYYTLLVSLAMENFYNNTQGQCGVCGGASCIRKGGQIEDKSCCDKTAYDWIVFENCSNYVNLNFQKKNCKFDSCYNPSASCSALEQAAEECKNAGFCVDWRRLTNGTCDVACPDGLVYRECYDKQDDFCYAGLRSSGASLKKSTGGCFCPSTLLRAGKHSNICVVDCSFCKGPIGEPKLPGEVWQSSCYVCTCNNQTYTEECFPKPPEPAPVCGPTAVLVNSSCCGDQICVEKTCRYNQQIYKAGDKWMDPAHPCVSFSCSKEGIQTETKVCPEENCPEEDRIWDDQHCCYTCKKGCAPMVSSINITIENCSTIIQMPVCHGQCAPQQRVVLKVDLVLEQENKCCTEQSSERRSVTLHCSDLTTREYTYKHITSCVCKPCSTI